LIPTSYLQEWSSQASWPDLQQVEQDLIICRSLCDLFNAPALTGKITFRGGTAINKLLFKQPLRSPLAQLSVWIGQTLVGGITELTNDQNLFAFTDDYVNNAERPVFTLSLY
jgi:hypothetical protein